MPTTQETIELENLGPPVPTLEQRLERLEQRMDRSDKVVPVMLAMCQGAEKTLELWPDLPTEPLPETGQVLNSPSYANLLADRDRLAARVEELETEQQADLDKQVELDNALHVALKWKPAFEALRAAGIRYISNQVSDTHEWQVALSLEPKEPA
jgi:hypothetical protein